MAQHAPRCGYATRESRQEWFEAHGQPLPGGDERRELPVDMLTANTDDPSAQLFHWQLYSLLGSDRIVALVRRFYERVFNDTDDPSFKQAFVQVAGLEHHVETQSAYWIDAMGGGKQYHGSGYRLKFHHENNAKQVMNAEGATRWMHHMTLTLEEFEPVFRAIDKRITSCIVDFLETKMKKYAKQFQWRFDKKEYLKLLKGKQRKPVLFWLIFLLLLATGAL
jgi:truncated hemoglobin YjbI